MEGEAGPRTRDRATHAVPGAELHRLQCLLAELREDRHEYEDAHERHEPGQGVGHGPLELLSPPLDHRPQLVGGGCRDQDGGAEPHETQDLGPESPHGPQHRESQEQDRTDLIDPREAREEFHGFIVGTSRRTNQGLAARYDPDMALTPQLIDLGHEALFRLARTDAAVEEEFAASTVRFFGEGPRGGADPVAALLEARRHQEWFLYERASMTLGGVPSEKLLGAWREAVPEVEDPEELEVALLESMAGVFAVRQVSTGGEAWIEDLGGLAEHVLSANPEAPPLEVGDLLIGRIHPSRAGGVVASPAAGVFRSPELLAAVEADLRTRREQGGSALLRFDQASLESAFYASPEPGSAPESPGSSAPDPAAALESARTFLAGAGLDRAGIDDLFARLRAAPLDPKRWAVGTEDALGEILDRLAFDTDVDLTQARALLGAAWHALRLEVDARKQEPKDVKAALADFDRGRAEGRDVQALLDDLERDLGLEGEPESDEGELAPPVLAGVVEMLVTEFRWEQAAGMGKGPALPETALAALDHLSRFGSAFEQPEELDGEALRRLLFFWAPEQRLPAAEARALMDALDAFVPWAESEHDLELVSTWKEVRGGANDLERVLAMNADLPTVLDAEGELFEVLEAEDPRGLPGLLVSEEGGVPARLVPSPSAFAAARPGDLLRGRRTDAGLEVFTAYPASARVG